MSEPKAYVEWENGTFDAYIWSWGGDPDPDFNMSIYIERVPRVERRVLVEPRARPALRGATETFDRDERQAIVHEFQRIHYEEIPEITLVYPELIHAYRTDTFEGYVHSPTGAALPSSPGGSTRT